MVGKHFTFLLMVVWWEITTELLKLDFLPPFQRQPISAFQLASQKKTGVGFAAVFSFFFLSFCFSFFCFVLFFSRNPFVFEPMAPKSATGSPRQLSSSGCESLRIAATAKRVRIAATAKRGGCSWPPKRARGGGIRRHPHGQAQRHGQRSPNNWCRFFLTASFLVGGEPPTSIDYRKKMVPLF